MLLAAGVEELGEGAVGEDDVERGREGDDAVGDGFDEGFEFGAALLEAGKVYERLDQWADAAETYSRLAADFPQDPDAPTARTRGEAARRRAQNSPRAAGPRP